MPKVLITGASDGIGRALVDVYAARGWDVLATGRRPQNDIVDPLPRNCTYVAADLAVSMDPLIDALPDELDLTILNAGVGKVAAPEAHSSQDIADMIALNSTAPLLLAHALYETLLASNGTLAFIGSTAAKGAHKDFSIYAATKAALAGAHRSLKLEWQGKVPVLMIHPGPTATGMHDKAGLGDIAIRRFFTPPNTVAEEIAKAIERQRDASFGLLFMLRHALRRSRL